MADDEVLPPTQTFLHHDAATCCDVVICGVCHRPAHLGLNCCTFCCKNTHPTDECWSLQRKLAQEAAAAKSPAAKASSPKAPAPPALCSRCDYAGHAAETCPTPVSELYCRYCRVWGQHVISGCETLKLNQLRKATPCCECSSADHCWFDCEQAERPAEQLYCRYCREENSHTIENCKIRERNEARKATPCCECGLQSHCYFDCNRVAAARSHDQSSQRGGRGGRGGSRGGRGGSQGRGSGSGRPMPTVRKLSDYIVAAAAQREASAKAIESPGYVPTLSDFPSVQEAVSA